MDFTSDLRHRRGLETVTCESGRARDEFFAEALANDRGRVRKAGLGNEQTNCPAEPGVTGPLVCCLVTSMWGEPR